MHKQKEGENFIMEEINLKELWHYFMSKIHIIIITMMLGVLIGNIYLFFIQTPMYKSTTSLVLVNEASNNTTITQNDILLNNNLVQTYSEIIKSRKVLSQVVRNLDLEESVEMLSNSTNVSAVTNTQLIKIVVSHSSNQQAKKIANEIAEVFVEEIQKIYKIQNISIVDKAQAATNPYNVSVVKQNIIYLLFGMIAGVGITFMIYYFDTSVKDAKTVEEKLNLTVLGVVPKVGDKHEKKK